MFVIVRYFLRKTYNKQVQEDESLKEKFAYLHAHEMIFFFERHITAIFHNTLNCITWSLLDKRRTTYIKS
ncbi:hypothetical protein CICLE_v10003062mg [Citrus x clementina]|uniref:Uncharacterized protein n=1 Tax=Citrus clementina TaxID=85681 RepID=V4T027_CITCL|nr:hypothetical protein CICLE_v10003062mg [Citrus x clementina]